MLKKTIALSQKKGSLLGAILLICGGSIGVGILSLPILTGHAGTLPTCVVFLLCCLFMSVTALLLLEVYLALKENHNFLSLAKHTLNKIGQYAVFGSFIFLFYSLTIAYLCKGGELVHHFYQSLTPVYLPEWTGATFLALLSGALIFLGPFIVDQVNRVFMAGFFLTYFYLIFSGNSYIRPENLSHIDWSYSLFIVPFVITSFGYHNVLPTISEYLGSDKKKLLQTVFGSGLILFCVYVLWVVILHGILPLHGSISIEQSFAHGEIVTEPLSLLIRSPLIAFAAQYMAFFAIITSILGQGLSVIDFLADSFRLQKTFPVRLLLCVALFLPTLLFSQLVPHVFFKALELAGGVAAMVLFGIIPPLMSWKIRYRSSTSLTPLVPGGRPVLIAIMAIASSIITYELLRNFYYA